MTLFLFDAFIRCLLLPLLTLLALLNLCDLEPLAVFSFDFFNLGRPLSLVVNFIKDPWIDKGACVLDEQGELADGGVGD